MPDPRRAVPWAAWFGLLLVVVAVLAPFRTEIDQSHVVLPLMLVVLGGSAGGGRPLGITLAIVGFLTIDYAFQPPYDLFTVDKALDWILLMAFLAAAFLATELVTQARQEAAAARRRAAEVSSLAEIGTETLRYATATESLTAIVALVRRALAAERCAVHLVDESIPTPVADGAAATAPEGALVASAVASGPTVLALTGGGRILAVADVDRDDAGDVEDRLVAVPIRVDTRILGALIVDTGRAVRIEPPRLRFLVALGHYAAVGIERQRLAGAVEEARAAQAANRAKDDVLAAVSHDLRTPLATIKVLAQRGPQLDAATAAHIETEADRLSRMVSDLLDLSRIRAGGIRLESDINTAEDLVGAATLRAEGVLGRRRIHATLDLASPTLAGTFDLVQSLRILGNLIDNAARVTPEGGTIDLSTSREGPWMVVRVEDRGPGVAAAEATRIFESFYRPRGAPSDAGRAGLGLSIARQLAELQGGSVTYEPRAGGGSTFTLRLPRAEWAAGALDED